MRYKFKFALLPYILLISIAVLAPLDQYQRDIVFGMSLQRIMFIFLSILFFILFLTKDRKIYFSPLIFPLFLYFIAQLIGAIQGEQSAAIRSITSTFGYIILFFVSANLPQSRKQVLIVLFFFIIGLFCVEMLAVLKLLTARSLLELNLIEFQQEQLRVGKILRMTGNLENLHDFTTLIQLTNQDLGIEEILRMKGTSENPNAFATLLVFALPMSMCLGIVTRRLWARSFLLLALFIGAICLLATQSRSAILGVSVGSLVLVVYFLRERRRVKTFILLAICFSIAGFTLFNDVKKFKRINLTARSMNKELYGLQENNKRIQIWKESSKFILAHPFGAGTGKSAEKISAYSGEIKKTRSPHNVFLAVGAQNGWLGIVSVFLIFAKVFYHLGVGVRLAALEFDKVLILGFLSSFIAFFIHSQFHSLLGWNIVWLVLGLAFATLKISKQPFPEVVT